MHKDCLCDKAKLNCKHSVHSPKGAKLKLSKRALQQFIGENKGLLPVVGNDSANERFNTLSAANNHGSNLSGKK
jgi:hypothetical protein